MQDAIQDAAGQAVEQHLAAMGCPDVTIAGIPYFSADHLAVTLGKDIRTLQRWARLRQGPPRTVLGKLVLYSADGVRRWLADREDKSSEPARRSRRRAA